MERTSNAGSTCKECTSSGTQRYSTHTDTRWRGSTTIQLHAGQHKPMYTSWAMLDSEKRKRKKDAPLVKVARQHNATAVMWAALVFTMQGLLGDEAETLLKTILGCHAKMLAMAPGSRGGAGKVSTFNFRDNYPHLASAVCARG
jgi:hypothetical protein